MSSNSIDSINKTVNTATQNKTSSSSSSSSILGKDDFLKLLVAQMKNQNPLNPSDPTQFTSQLAQFSSLEQLYNLNDSMTSLATSNTNSTKLTTLGTIGKDVAFANSSFNYDGKQPVTLGYQLDNPAQRVTVSIKQNGTTIANLVGTDLGAGTHYLTWDGLNSSGEQVGAGDYSIVVDATPAQGDKVTATPVVRAEVTGVDLGTNSTATLITNSGNVASDKVLGVFDKTNSSTSSEESTSTVNNSSSTSDTTDGSTADSSTGSTNTTGTGSVG